MIQKNLIDVVSFLRATEVYVTNQELLIQENALSFLAT